MSNVFDNLLHSVQGQAAFGELRMVDALLRFEAALTAAQCRAGWVPQVLAQSIIGTCKVDLFDPQKLVRDAARAGCLSTPVVAALQETVALFNPAAVPWIHLGCSHQHAVDAALLLLARDALDTLMADAQTCLAGMQGGAQHQTHAAWLGRSLQRLQGLRPLALQLHLPLQVPPRPVVAAPGGLRGPAQLPPPLQPDGSAVADWVAESLGLGAKAAGAPLPPWALAGDWLALCSELGLLSVVLGQWAQSMAAGGAGGGALAGLEPPLHRAMAAAQRSPQRLAGLLACAGQAPCRSAWQAAQAEATQLLVLAQSAAQAMAAAVAADGWQGVVENALRA